MIALLPPYQLEVKSMIVVENIACGHFDDLLKLESLLINAFRNRPGKGEFISNDLHKEFKRIMVRVCHSIPELRSMANIKDRIQALVDANDSDLYGPFIALWPRNSRILALFGNPSSKVTDFIQLFQHFCKLRHAVWLLGPMMCWKVAQPSITMLGQVRDIMAKRAALTVDMRLMRYWVTRSVVWADKTRNRQLVAFWAAMESFLLALDLEFLMDTRIKFEQALLQARWTFSKNPAGYYTVHYDVEETLWAFENRIYAFPRIWIGKALEPPHTWLWLQDESGTPLIRTRSVGYKAIENAQKPKEEEEKKEQQQLLLQ